MPITDLDPVDYTPIVDEVAALERTRTVGTGVGGLGGDTDPQNISTFDDTTRPSATEVEALIADAVDSVLAEIGPSVTDVHAPAIRRAAALYTAILIEGSYFDKSDPDEGQVALWLLLYRRLMDSLALATDAPSDGGSGAASGPRRVDSVVLRGVAAQYDPYPDLPDYL